MTSLGDEEMRKKLDPICDLFRAGDPEFRTISPVSRYWLPTAGVVMGLMMSTTANMMNRRPLVSGVQKHVTLAVLGFVIGEWMWQRKLEVFAEKDLQYYHYMTLHPEDFPPPRKVQFRNYLEPWVPIR